MKEENKFSKSKKFYLIGLLIIIFLIKILISIAFFAFYYFNYKKIVKFSNKESLNDKCNNSDINLNLYEDKNSKDSENLNNQSNHQKSSIYNNYTLENLRINNNNFSNVKKSNEKIESILVKQNDIVFSKIKLIKCISFLNSFDFTFQFLIVVNWLWNFYLSSKTDDKFLIFYLSLLYSIIFIQYLIIIDNNTLIYLLAKLINCLVIGILEKLKLTNISFFNNLLFLLSFWIIIYFAIKNKNKKNEINLHANQNNSEVKIGNNTEEDLLFAENFHLIINLKEEKGEIINKEFKQLFHNIIKRNYLDKIISFPKNFIEECKLDVNKELKPPTLNSFKNYKNQNTKEKEIINQNFSKNLKDKNIHLNYNSFSNKKNHDLLFNQNVLNPKLECNSNLSDSENPNIDLKKKFIFNNLNFLKILLEINDFNFDLSEEIVDCYINLSKCFMKYRKDDKIEPEIFSENEKKEENPKKEKKNNKIYEKICKNENLENKSRINNNDVDFMLSPKKIKDSNPINKNSNGNLSEYKLENKKIENNLFLSKNHFEIINNLNNENSNLNDFISKDNNNYLNANQYYKENSLIEKLINLINVICQEIKGGDCSVFLGIIKSLNMNSDKEFSCYGVSVSLTENKNFLILKINEIKDFIRFIEIKTEYKFKNLYLKKICHEFKNPLLNILQLIKNSKQNFKSITKDNISNYSKNIHLSHQISSNSNISNFIQNRKTLFKGSSKNYNELNFNKSARSNLSIVGEESYNRNESNKGKINILGVEKNIENQNKCTNSKWKNENESIYSNSNQNKYSINISNSKNININPLSCNNFEGENIILETENSEKIKFICDNLILSITEFDFLIEFSYKNIKKLNNLYKNENFSEIISDGELFQNDLKKETFESFQENKIVKGENQYKSTENNVDVFKLIKYFIQIFETKISLIGKNITLFSYVHSCIPDKIIFDEIKLKLIIFNLLSNALKFSNYGKIGIILEYNRETRNLLFFITDTGIGISSDILNKIGEPYFKTNFNNNDFGIGMGIYIVKQIVKSLNGKFTIESEINKGTRVIIEFPYDIEEKAKIYEDINKNLEIKLSRYKSPNISMLYSARDKENILKKNFKNTELNFNSLNQLKSKYEIYDNCIESNLLNNPINKFDNLIFSFNENVRRKSMKDKSSKYKFSSQKSIFNAYDLKKEYEESNELENQSTIKDLSQNMTFNMRKVTCTNKNIENNNEINKEICDLKNSILTSNTKAQKKRRSLFNCFMGNLYPEMTSIEECMKRCFTSKVESNKNINNIELGNDQPKNNDKLSFKSIDKPYKKNNKNSTNKCSNNYMYFVNNITNDNVDLNISLENSSGGETVKIDDTLINKNLNSLKREKGKIFNDIHKNNSCDIYNPNDIKLLNPKINGGDRGYYNIKKFFKSGKTSLFESNLEMNSSSQNVNGFRSENENESNSFYIITSKRKPSNNDFKIDTKDLNAEKNKFNDQENPTFSIGSQTSNKDNKIKELYNPHSSSLSLIEKNQDISSKFIIEKDKGLFYSDISSKFYIEKKEGINNSDISRKSQIEKSRAILSSDSSSKILIEKDRILHNPDITKRSQAENNTSLKDTIEPRKSSLLTDNNILHDGKLMILNDNNKNSDNLCVVLNIEEQLYCHLLSDNIRNSDKKELKEEFILSSMNFNKLRDRIPNYDINRSCIISKEQINTITNILEQKKIEPNININKGDVLRILIVDDEKLIRQSHLNLIKKYSEKNNILIEIEECEDGIECLYKIYKGLQIGKIYNLIITDETMNFLKGSFMAKIIKKLIAENISYKIKIIMVTSYGAENYADLKGAIVEKVYSKPMSINMIHNIFN